MPAEKKFNLRRAAFAKFNDLFSRTGAPFPVEATNTRVFDALLSGRVFKKLVAELESRVRREEIGSDAAIAHVVKPLTTMFKHALLDNNLNAAMKEVLSRKRLELVPHEFDAFRNYEYGFLDRKSGKVLVVKLVEGRWLVSQANPEELNPS